MFLFNKKTRNIIKYIWGGLASLVVLSMIITYSGFTSLARTSNQEQIEIPDEVKAQMEAQKKGETFNPEKNTPEEEQILKALEEKGLDTISTTSPQTSSTPTPQTLELKI